MPNPRLFSALLTIRCTDETLQTGWFFTDVGHILTAGHGITGSGLGKGAIVSVSRQSDRRKLSAKIIEIGSGSLDYAILQIEEPSVCPVEFLQVDPTWSPKYFRSQFYGGGYADFIEQSPTEIQGTVASQAIRPRENLIQLLMDADFDAEGLSGCPVILDSSDKVFALQVRQPEAAEELLFAVPLHLIFTASPRFRQLVEVMRAKLAVFQWDITKLDRKLFSAPSVPRRAVRVVYFLKPIDTESQGHRLFRHVQEHWEEFKGRLKGTHRELAQYISSSLLLGPELEVANILAPGVEGSDELRLYFSSACQEAPSEKGIIRCVCDLSRSVKMHVGPPLSEMDGASHLVGVTFQEGAVAVGPSDIPNVNSLFALPCTAPGQFANMMFDIIEDMFVDISLFYSTGIIPKLYFTAEARQAFSESKVAFAKERNLFVYGTAVNWANLQYVSLASCCRPSFAAPLDYRALMILWHKFVDGYLLHSLQPRERAETAGVRRDAVVAQILKTPKLRGQVPVAELNRRLLNFRASPGELCAVALIKRAPKIHKKAEAMKSFFKVRALRVNRPRVFRQPQLPGLLQFRQFIHIFLFRWRS